MHAAAKQEENKEAAEILNIYRFFRQDGSLYLKEEGQSLDMLFDAVIGAINNCRSLKPQLPYNEFVRPSKKVEEGDEGWVGHFMDEDNKRFFLSDVYDYLYLLYGKKA